MDTAEARYARGKSAKWLLGLLKSGVSIDGPFWECLEWTLGDLRKLLLRIGEELKRPALDDESSEIDGDVRALLSRIRRNTRIYEEIHEFMAKYSRRQEIFWGAVRSECAAAMKISEEDGAAYRRARLKLRRIFGLNREACAFCEFLFIKDAFPPVENYFEEHLEIHKIAHRKMFAGMLGMKPAALQTCMSELVSWGICEKPYYGSCCNLMEGLASFWEDSASVSLENLFYRPLLKRSDKTLPLENFGLPADDVAHVKALLESEGDFPIHILLYGEPGTGKTTFVRSLARELKLKAWAVPCGDKSEKEAGRTRRAGLIACLNMASKHKGAFVLLDEAERFLDTGDYSARTTKDKAWINDFLEQPGRRVVWVVNDIEHVHPSVRRRFAYSVHFKPLNCEERRRIWKNVLKEYRVTKYLPEERAQKFAGDYRVSPAVVESAVRQAKTLTRNAEDFAAAAERVLRSHVTLVRNGVKPLPKSPLSGEYTLDGVSLEGSIGELLGQCRRIDAMMREGKPMRPGGATMLFYGPPGSGKSALAKYLADELERELVVKRASALLSPYVGMSERNVAAAFREAEEAVLVIDEADSFLYSRDGAVRSWEVTLVNEFLTALEECRGFCVCTTNRVENMDEASTRRFSFKVPFGYAGSGQVRALYESLLAPLADGDLPQDIEKELSRLRRLTPGDFHAVKSQYWLAEPGSVTHARLVENLAREEKLKRDRQAKRVGF
jgi:SpoVK/Ycf46/Vps4 family AAA+-type ATPase